MKKRVLAIVMAALLMILSSCSGNGNDVSRTYDEAMNAMKQGKYTEAEEKLSGISFYLDSVQLALYCRAHAWAEDGNYDSAISELQRLGTFRDSAKCAIYFNARKAEDTADTPWSRAYTAELYDDEQINGFRDSSKRADTIRNVLYSEGSKAEEAEEWQEAAEIFGALKFYLDSPVRSGYNAGRMYESEGENKPVMYAYAVHQYESGCDYKDSINRMKTMLTASLEKADQMIADENFDGAEEIYTALGKYCGKEQLTALEEAREKAAERDRLKALEEQYQKAAKFVEDGETEKAAGIYLEIKEYKDSRDRHYLLGQSLMEKDPDAAVRILLDDREYPGAADDLYTIALAASETEKYALSISIYNEFLGRRDCTLRMMNDLYLYGQQLLAGNEPDHAAEMFDRLGGIGSASLYAYMARYAAADALETSGAFEAAANAFNFISIYADAADRAEECRYLLASELKKDRNYLRAAQIFADLGDRHDSVEQEKDCRYLLAGVYEEQSLWEKAIGLYADLKDYSDSKAHAAKCYRQLGLCQLEDDDAEAAYRSFVYAGDAEGMAKAAFAVGESKTAAFSLKEALEWYKLAPNLPETEERTVMVAQSLLNMEEDGLCEQFASIVQNSEKTRDIFYTLALRALEHRDMEAAIRQMKKTGDNVDTSDRLRTILNGYVETLISEENYIDAAFFCTSFGEQERADEILRTKAQKEEEERQRILAAEQAEYDKKAAEAAKQLNEGNYEEAQKIYQELGDQNGINETIYRKACEMDMPELYLTIPDYKDSREQHFLAGTALLESDPEKAFAILADDISYGNTMSLLYILAESQSEAENYRLSAKVFRTLGMQPLDPQDPKSDCLMRYLQDEYQYGLQLIRNGSWEAAAEIFDALGSLGEAADRSHESHYEIAAGLENNAKYSQAAVAFEALGNYKDSPERAKMNRYNAAKEQFDAGAYKNAEAAFLELGEYSNSAELVKECRYQQAIALFNSGIYDQASDMFSDLGDYSSSAEKKQECIYQIAGLYMKKGLYAMACDTYKTIQDYGDSAEKIKACHAAIGDYEIAKAEKYLKDRETEKAATAYQAAYTEYQLTDNTDKTDNLVLMIARCYHAINKLNTALEWYRKDGDNGRISIAGIAEFALETEQEEIAEAIALTLDTDKGKAILYRMAEMKLTEEDDEAAIRLFWEAGDYQDAQSRYQETKYRYAEKKIEEGLYDDAEALAAELGEIEYQKIVYQIAEKQLELENEDEAVRLFRSAGDYLDAKDRCDSILYRRAAEMIEDEDYVNAIRTLDMIPDYADVQEKKNNTLYALAVKAGEIKTEDAGDLKIIRDAQEKYVNDMISAKDYASAIPVLENMNVNGDYTELIKSIRYKWADQLEIEGKNREASVIFRMIGDYEDAIARADNTMYRQAMTYKKEAEYDLAIECLRQIPEYEDSRDQVYECLYLKAGKLTEEGSDTDALAIYQSIIDYRDVRSILTSNKAVQKSLKEWRASIAPGSCLSFGKKEGEDIQWFILDRDGEYLLLISKDCLGQCAFDDKNKSRVTWQHSSLRAYMNEDMMEQLFTEDEKLFIRLSPVIAEKSEDLAVSPGNNTEDYLYVLNTQEYNQYKQYLPGIPTETNWWLRSPGSRNGSIRIVNDKGTRTGTAGASEIHGVRPVLWVRDGAFIVLTQEP